MSNEFKKSCNIGLISCPLAKANVIPFSNYVDILSVLTNKLVVIVPCKKNVSIPFFENVMVRKINYYETCHLSLNILSYVWSQFIIVFNLIYFKNIDVWIFYIGEGLLFPILIAKILGKKVLLSLGGYSEKEITSYGKYVFYILLLIIKITFMISDYIILYSPILINKWNLSKFENKILIAHKHHLNFNFFNVKTKINERSSLIGYIGRLSTEKGILNFVESIPTLAKINNKLSFLIGGDGPLKEEVTNYINLERLNNVELVGWISHNDLPEYLNSLKLIIIPSYTEGLPNIILESMACGTIVLTTPVGAIPDIVVDSKTGFIMENNSPECIVENVIRVLKYSNLNEISENARILVRQRYSYEAAVEKYQEIIKYI